VVPVPDDELLHAVAADTPVTAVALMNRIAARESGAGPLGLAIAPKPSGVALPQKGQRASSDLM
jgi:hypothetical protein